MFAPPPATALADTYTGVMGVANTVCTYIQQYCTSVKCVNFLNVDIIAKPQPHNKAIPFIFKLSCQPRSIEGIPTVPYHLNRIVFFFIIYYMGVANGYIIRGTYVKTVNER